MTSDGQQTAGKAPAVSAPLSDKATKPPAPAMERIVLRFALLVALIIAVDLWFIGQFDLNVTTLVGVEVAIAVPTALLKSLHRQHRKPIEELFDRAFYALLRWRVLVAAWTVFLGITAFVSTVTFTGKGAESVCISRKAGDPCRTGRVLAPDKKRFVLLTTPFGRAYVVRLGDGEPRPLRPYAWVPTTSDTKDFVTLLMRIAYPHADVDGGRIELRDQATRRCLAYGDMTADSASLVFGGAVDPTETQLQEWRLELAGTGDGDAEAAALRAWKNAVRARPCKGKKLELTKGPFEAVFRTARQIELAAEGKDELTASWSGSLEPGAMQDVLLRRSR